MKRFILVLIVPILFGALFIGCEPIEEGDLPPIEEEQPMQ